MKISLIYPDIFSFHHLPYNPGLAYVAAYLMSKGHEVRVHYIDKQEDIDGAVDQIIGFKPGMVGFASVETQFSYVKAIASKIKKSHSCLVVCGGAHVTLAPEVVLEPDSPIDAVVVGEGEYAASELASCLEEGRDWTGVSNLAYKDKDTGRLVRNRVAPYVSDLDSLPYPATELFPYQSIIDSDNIAMFHFSRGCPYQCTFCSNSALGKVYGSNEHRLRYRSAASAVNEIKRTLARYRLREDTRVNITDDLFVSNKKWLEEFCALYKKEVGRPFWCTARSNLITDEVCRMLKDAGCYIVMMSVESGNDFIRNEVLRRGISRETMFRSFDLCYKHKINTLATCIIGLPYETPAMIEETIATVARLKSIVIYGINIFYPYKGTYLRTLCEEKGLLPTGFEPSIAERRDSVLVLPDLPKETILYYRNNWTRLIMKHKGRKEQAKYYLRMLYDRFKDTGPGHLTRSFIKNTKIGRRMKRFVLRHVWNWQQ